MEMLKWAFYFTITVAFCSSVLLLTAAAVEERADVHHDEAKAPFLGGRGGEFGVWGPPAHHLDASVTTPSTPPPSPGRGGGGGPAGRTGCRGQRSHLGASVIAKPAPEPMDVDGVADDDDEELAARGKAALRVPTPPPPPSLSGGGGDCPGGPPICSGGPPSYGEEPDTNGNGTAGGGEGRAIGNEGWGSSDDVHA